MTVAFVAWRAPETRTWYTVGRIESEGQRYRFSYTNGAIDAFKEAEFRPFVSFPDLLTWYESNELFPLFANRILPRSRPEYGDFVKWLSVPEHNNDPIALLARSGGRRQTDTLEIFQQPEPDHFGLFQMHFFVHGMQYMPPEALRRAEQLVPGEPLMLMHDFQNPFDSSAMMIRTAEHTPGDIYTLGYCPRYLLEDVFKLLIRENAPVQIFVLRVNPTPAPIWFRLLCRLAARWPVGYTPFQGEQYLPVNGIERRVFLHGGRLLSSAPAE